MRRNQVHGRGYGKLLSIAALAVALTLGSVSSDARQETPAASDPSAAPANKTEPAAAPPVSNTAAAAEKSASRRERPKAAQPAGESPSPSPTASPTADAIAEECGGAKLSTCIASAVADLPSCDRECPASVRKQLVPLRALILRAAAASPSSASDPSWATVQLALDCLGNSGPDDRACRFLFDLGKPRASEAPAKDPRARQPKPAEASGGSFASVRLVDLAILTLCTLSVLLLSAPYLQRWRRGFHAPDDAPAEDGASADEDVEPQAEPDDAGDEEDAASGGPSSGAEDATAGDAARSVTPQDQAGIQHRIGQRARKEPKLYHESPIGRREASTPEGDSNGQRSTARDTGSALPHQLDRLVPLMGIDQSAIPAILSDVDLRVSDAGLETLPDHIRQTFALIRALHKTLRYDVEPSAQQQADLNRALQSLDSSYSLFWVVGHSIGERRWYSKVREEPSYGKGWLKKVAYPGLTFNGEPVVTAEIEVGYGARSKG